MRRGIVDTVDMDVPKLLQAVEEHLQSRARIARPLQASDGRLHEFLGQPHDAVVLGMDARTSADDHGGDEKCDTEGGQRNNQRVEPESDGHLFASLDGAGPEGRAVLRQICSRI